MGITKNNTNKNICLNYHAFSGSKAYDQVISTYTVDFELFKAHLDLLQEKQNLGLPELLIQNNFEFTYSLTFDDGYKSHLYVAEELAKRKLKGTFYIITDETKTNSRYMNIGDLKVMDSLGMEIGSHTCSHRHVNRLTKKEMIMELHDSKCFLEDILSKPVNSISYPGGHFSSREVDQAIIEGYKTQRTCITGLNLLPLNSQIIKCFNIKDFADVDYMNQLIELNNSLRTFIKMREIGLIIPKYINSKWKHLHQKFLSESKAIYY